MKIIHKLQALFLTLCLFGSLCGCSDSSDNESNSSNTSNTETKTTLTSENYDYFGNLGSATEMEGTTVVLSIFANDSNASWDWNSEIDQSTASDMLAFTEIATNWLTEQAAAYNCDAEFIYDWSIDENLSYDAQIDGDLLSEDDCELLSNRYINANIDSEAILEEYNADNIVYTFFLNTEESLELTSCTYSYYEGMRYPYEMCFIYSHCDGTEETPAAIAHEILHTFGAPDLYTADTDGYNYGISEDYVNELDYTASNDIMYTTFDCYTWVPYYDRITNEFSEIDAYYTGLTNHSDVVDEWGFGASQHEEQ